MAVIQQTGAAQRSVIRHFRYDRIRTYAWFQRWFRRFAWDHGLALEEARDERTPRLSDEDLQAAIGEYWNAEKRETLRQMGLLPLAADRVEQICRSVALHTLIFRREQPPLRVEVSAAPTNEYSVIAWNTFMDETPTLYGGRVAVTAPTEAEALHIAGLLVNPDPL